MRRPGLTPLLDPFVFGRAPPPLDGPLPAPQPIRGAASTNRAASLKRLLFMDGLLLFDFSIIRLLQSGSLFGIVSRLLSGQACAGLDGYELHNHYSSIVASAGAADSG